MPRDPIELHDGCTIGRGSECEVVLDDPSVSRRHLVIHRVSGSWEIEDVGSRTGSFLNGRIFQREELVLGDIVRVGSFSFRFDGRALTDGMGGARLDARCLAKTSGTVRTLDGVSLTIQPGEFVGILGPSGAGKSTLLDALCGLRPADTGEVYVDGLNLTKNLEALRPHLGYVPQDDIVPLELSVRDALAFSARLRMPGSAPAEEMHKLVERTMRQMGLDDRATTPVRQLSGGQRKRVSVGAEVLGRPRLLFLDEPTSGLDPSAEWKLMQVLRELAAVGCSVICTTHIMENAHLMDRLFIMDTGRLVFVGSAAEARERFGVSRLTMLYDHLGGLPSVTESDVVMPTPVEPPAPPRRRRAALPVLMWREWAILFADKKAPALVLAQPVFIGLMVTWVTHDAALILFYAMVSALWFGCGNAAQEIVKEWPMYRRERLIGLGRHAYLLAKFLSLSRLTVVQSLTLYGVMEAGCGGIAGSVGWQLAALVATSLASVGLGLAISACSRSILQAVMLVPLVLIPQILFSGFTPPAGDMKSGPWLVSKLMPSASTQSVMDVSLLWGEKIRGATRVDFPTAFTNLNRGKSLKNGMIFQNPSPAWAGLGTLAAWCVATYLTAWAALRSKERG